MGEKLPRWQIFIRMRAYELESSQGSSWKEERPWEQGYRNDRKCQSPVLSWTPPANEGLFNAKFDILVPRASILLVSVSDRSHRSLTLTKRIEALWTRMEIWWTRFMKLLHKFPYGGPYGPVMWRAFERKGKKKNGRKKRKKKSLECAFTHLGFFTRSAVMKSLACCEMGSKCFGLNSYLTSVILRHVSSTVSPWKGDTPLRLQRKNKNCDKYLFNQYTRLCQTGNFS